MSFNLNLSLTKMQGTGNDFLIFNALSLDFYSSEKSNEEKNSKIDEESELIRCLINNKLRPKFVKKICARHYSIGADGFIFLEKNTSDEAVDFSWDFYNSDGSPAEMCGNAARCVARYALDKIFPEKKMISFLTQAGIIEAEVVNVDTKTFFKVKMTKILNVKWDQSLVIEDNHFDYHYINSGVPHVVIELEHFKADDSLKNLSRKIQKSSEFQPQSTNITYLSTFLGENSDLSHNNGDKILIINSITFERGVFNFTKACGTGAVAAAYCIYKKNNQKYSRVKVLVPGGELYVDFKDEEVYLIGPAEYVAELYPYI